MSAPSGERAVKLFVTFAVIIVGVYVSVVSVTRFGRFLADRSATAGGDSSSGLRLPPFDSRMFFRISLNLTLASCYLYSPLLVKHVVQKVGNSCGLPNCYFKFTKIVILSSILNGVITLWQAVPEICLWHLNTNHADNIHFYLHCSVWIMSLMIVLAIDITEVTGLNSIFYYHLTDGKCSLKSREFDRFLANIGVPGSSCLIVALWAQKVMSFDRFLLAVIWTSGILSCNQTDSKDIEYVARQIERKKSWMYFAEGITVSPLN